MASDDLPLNEVLQGDCVDILKTLPDQSVDLVFADPPYNLQLRKALLRPDQSLVEGVDDAWDKFTGFSEYDLFTSDWLRESRRVLKNTGAIWVIGSYHNIFRVGKTMMDLGFWILNDVVWHKTNPMPNFRGSRFTNATETLLWAKKSFDQPRYTFNYHAMKNLNGGKQMQSVWRIPLCVGPERVKVNGKKAHSTQKPEALLYRVILASTNPDDIILDPFFGTGTTGAVAKKMKRHFIGIELEPEYVRIARERIARVPELPMDTSVLMTRSRRSLPRVRFGRLIEANYLRPGQKLYARQREYVAVVKADSLLMVGDFTGSIHQTASYLQGKASANGWDFWFYEDETGKLMTIDHLRERYRQEYEMR
jgi:site-specific DNA-methyltransferase (adenine-specific)/modification methylase